MGRDASLAELRSPRPGTRDELATPVPPAKRGRRAPLWAKAFIAMGAVLVVGSTGTVAAGKLIAKRYEGSVQRDDLLGAAAPAAKEPAKVNGPLTFLVMGSDSRAGDNFNPETPDGSSAAVGGAPRSDTIIMMHVPKTMDRAYVVSIPRDTYISIADKNGDPAGKNKINAAFAFGGAPRLVQTLNNFTGSKIDYPVIVDFSAVRKITDLVGGVDVVVDTQSYDEYRFMPKNTTYPTTPCIDTHGRKQRCLTFKKGPLHLDGQLAEYYVRQRTGLQNGDLDRAKRQQQFLRALMSKAASGDMLTDPVKFDKFVRTVGGAITVDKRMPVNGLAFSLKKLRPADLVFMTLPTAGFADVPGVGNVVRPNVAQSKELFAAIDNGTMDQYLLKYPTASNDVSHGS
jgi:LCP family protein required for cell wall assembly